MPVQDPVLKLPLCHLRILYEHLHVAAIGVHAYQARGCENHAAVEAHAVKAAQQAGVGREAAPADTEVFGLSEHRLATLKLAVHTLAENDSTSTGECLDGREIPPIGGYRRTFHCWACGKCFNRRGASQRRAG